MPMTHQELMRLRPHGGECAGECVAIHTGQLYTVYRCKGCQMTITALDGQPHETNYALLLTPERRLTLGIK